MSSVRLISYSQSVPTEPCLTLNQLVAHAARVSNPGNQNNHESADKLIAYLIKNKHWSPLEMVNVCLEITTTRDIARQILRHRSFSFQEYSQRYADPTKDLVFVIREARLQDKKNRQSSIETEDNILQEEWAKRQQAVIDTALENYTWAVNNGIAKEQARAVLPEGNTQSILYISGTMRSWIHYIEARTDSTVQKEHRGIALACAEVINCIFKLPVLGD